MKTYKCQQCGTIKKITERYIKCITCQDTRYLIEVQEKENIIDERNKNITL